MSREEYEATLKRLSKRQLLWLGHKARWEQMTKWAVLNEGWHPPLSSELKSDGTNR